MLLRVFSIKMQQDNKLLEETEKLEYETLPMISFVFKFMNLRETMVSN